MLENTLQIECHIQEKRTSLKPVSIGSLNRALHLSSFRTSFERGRTALSSLGAFNVSVAIKQKHNLHIIVAVPSSHGASARRTDLEVMKFVYSFYSYLRFYLGFDKERETKDRKQCCSFFCFSLTWKRVNTEVPAPPPFPPCPKKNKKNSETEKKNEKWNI